MPTRLKHLLFGRPRDLADRRLFHRLSLIPFLAWVGLGADGLSSSAYGPEEAFKALGQHGYLAVALALLMGITVLVISTGYSRIIEEFPRGGGGYLVASKLLGPTAGVVSGSALLVDYVLTITISIAAAGDALFSFLPSVPVAAKVPVEIAFILGLTTLNIRGVRESVVTLLPVFLLFLVTHFVVIGWGIVGHLPQASDTARALRHDFQGGVNLLGVGGLLLVFLRAYSLGGGTYTGIEAVSNGLPIMRAPRVRTGKRTMLYMGVSLAFTASGLLLCYLLWGVTPAAGKTMNAVLVERMAGGWPLGGVFIVLFLFAEAMLLVVAAQAGFIDGPRVLGNMAVDSWVPHHFAALSERLTTRNGIVLMGGAALLALLYTQGRVGQLVVMYSINVFLTFSLSMFAMLQFWIQRRGRREKWKRRIGLFAVGFALCATILLVTIFEKFAEGGWITVVITALLIGVCLIIRRHYRKVEATVDDLHRELGDLPTREHERPAPLAFHPRGPTAALLVGSFGGVGIHTYLNIFRAFPRHFKNLVVLSVGVLDSGDFKGERAVEDVKRRTEEMLARYVALAESSGIPAAARFRLGTDVVQEAERLCLEVSQEFPHTTFFAGRLIFQRDSWWRRLLHNDTPQAIQERLQWAGKTMVTLPIRVREAV